MKAFRWNDWNIESCTKHGCTVAEVESIIENAGHGYPRRSRKDSWKVVGRGQGGRFVEIVFLRDADGTIYPIHAMPLTTRRRRG